MFQNMVTKAAVMGLGIMILFISMARTGVELAAQEGVMESLKNNEIQYMATFSNGETETGNYKFPETGLLPDNITYGFKRIRDFFWLLLARGDNKNKLAILLADKKAMEFVALTKKDKNMQAIEAGNEAVDKLKYANGLIVKDNKLDNQTKQLRAQVFWAGFAYKEVFKRYEQAYNLDNEEYSKLLSTIDDWNKEQEKSRYTWDF
jgi:hypothetical protein